MTRKGQQEMALRTGRMQRTDMARRVEVTRLARRSLAVVALGGGVLAAGSLAFAAPASAKGASSTKALIIKKVHIAKIGTVLATSSGRTLYRYTADPAGMATCTGACAKVWPPLLLPKGDTKLKAPHGVKGLSVARAADGRSQVFFHDEALYRFEADTKKGEVKGQGVEGAWYAVLSDGKSSAPKSATTSSAPASTPTTAAGTATTTTVPKPATSGTKATTTTVPMGTTTTPVTTKTPTTVTPTTVPPRPTTTTTTSPPTTTTTAPSSGGVAF
jgi:predicted lipoprotein with Yx(FWY)xxD motif